MDYLWTRRELRLVLLLMTLVAVLAMPYYVLLPMLARDTLGVGPRGFGILMAASGLGAFLGGLTLAHRLQSRPPMPSFWRAWACFSWGCWGWALRQLLRRPGLHLYFRFRHGDPDVHRQQPVAAQCAG